ncbi:MAG TPA: hypothetical protein PKJ99_09430 [Thermoanaerobaculales bacterium]|nr:hypothetical protein [Thermoanaerobaculales bacterium]
MSEIRTSRLNGVFAGCTRAITTVAAIIANAHAERREYLERQLGTHDARLALCSQLGPCLVRAGQEQQLRAHVHALITATSTETTQAAATLVARVHQEQQAVAKALTPLLIEATRAAGFTRLRQLHSPDRVLLIGEDTHGRALQHEVLLVPSQPLTLRSETIGFRDGSCAHVLDRFEASLRHHGVTIARHDRAGTLRRAAQLRVQR